MKRWGTAELSLPVRCPRLGAKRTSLTDGVFGSELTAHCTTNGGGSFVLCHPSFVPISPGLVSVGTDGVAPPFSTQERYLVLEGLIEGDRRLQPARRATTIRCRRSVERSARDTPRGRRWGQRLPAVRFACFHLQLEKGCSEIDSTPER